MGVNSNHEEKRKMVSVPKRLETLVADLVVRGGVHQHHDQEHEMTSDAPGLRVVDLQSNLLSDLSAFDVEKVDIVSGSMDHSPESHRVGDLTVEPDVLVGREQPLNLGSDDTNDIPKHGKENKTSVEGKNETCTTGGPYGPRQSIESSKLRVGCLSVPPITKEEKVETIEDNVEGKPSSGEEFPLYPTFTHWKRSEIESDDKKSETGSTRQC